MCARRHRERQVVDYPRFPRRHYHAQRRQPQIRDGVRFATGKKYCPSKPYVVKDLSEDAVRVWGCTALVGICQCRADIRVPFNVHGGTVFCDSRQLLNVRKNVLPNQKRILVASHAVHPGLPRWPARIRNRYHSRQSTVHTAGPLGPRTPLGMPCHAMRHGACRATSTHRG